jgi:hypothetical protein
VLNKAIRLLWCEVPENIYIYFSLLAARLRIDLDHTLRSKPATPVPSKLYTLFKWILVYLPVNAT